MELKYPILNKLRPGHKCRYIGKDKIDREDGFIYGREYFIIDRLPRIIVFSTNIYQFAIDFGLNDCGDYFFENWEVVDEGRLINLPDIDFSRERFYLFYDMIKLNSEIKE